MGIIIQGGGGHAKVVADCLLAQGKEIVAFVDSKYVGDLLGYPRRAAFDFDVEALTLIAIGDNATRKKLSQAHSYHYINAIHPSVIFSSFARLGVGNMLLHGAIVQAGSVLGNHVIVNTGAQIDHDCVIGDYVHIAPRVALCGNVMVGEGSLIGVGAVITPGRKIGAWATVGAGSVIIQDVPDYAVVVGNPGRIIKYNRP